MPLSEDDHDAIALAWFGGCHLTRGPLVTDAELVREAVRASGLSAERFADAIQVNRRTVFRWLAGISTIRDRAQRARVTAYAERAEVG